MVRKKQQASKLGLPPRPSLLPASNTQSTSLHRSPSKCGLTALPAELINRVLEDSRPEGFEPLVLTCKYIYGVAAAGMILEHNVFKRRYLACTINFEASKEEDSHFEPVDLLYEILQNPVAAKYVFSLELNCVDDVDERNPHTDPTNLDLRFLEDNHYIRKASQDPEEWQDAIKCGNKFYIQILLLILLPNVQALRLYYTWHTDLVNPQNEGAMEVLNSIVTDDRPQCSLSRLYHMLPYESDTKFGAPLQDLAPFLALPSLKRVQGIMYSSCAGGDSDGRSYEWPYGDRTSNVEEVTLLHAAIDASSLDAFLKPLPRLRTFKYEHKGFGDGTGFCCDGGGLLIALEKYFSKTLQTLSLRTTASGQGSRAYHSFRNFERLRYLELDMAHFAGLRDPDYTYDGVYPLERTSDSPPRDHILKRERQLVDMLPESLETLGIFYSDLGLLNTILDDFKKNRRTLLPNLSKTFTRIIQP